MLITGISACNEDAPVPRPRGYFRIELPKHQFRTFAPDHCPFQFNIPVYAEPLPDTNRFAEPCWWYINLPTLNGQIYITYKEVKGDANQFMEDTRTLVYKHTAKANAINETMIHNGSGISGVVYDIGGHAASPIQFFITDSTRHFLRGALYFNTEPNADSLAPLVTQVREDIREMITSFRWTAKP